MPGIIDMESGLIWYEFTEEDSFYYKLQGLEWPIFAMIIFIVSFVGLHALFWGGIRGRRIFGLINRSIFLKTIDYIWYAVGLFSVLFVLASLNAREASMYHANAQAEFDELLQSRLEYLSNSEEECKAIVNADGLDEPEQEIAVFKSICLEIAEETLFAVDQHCFDSGKHWDWGQNHPTYSRHESRPDVLTDALNYFDVICSVIGRIEKVRLKITAYERASNKYFRNENKTYPVWLALFPIVVSLRLVKTSAEFSDALKTN